MKCLIRWYCAKCKTEWAGWTDETGSLKSECPNCKKKTDYDQVFGLETLQVG